MSWRNFFVNTIGVWSPSLRYTSVIWNTHIRTQARSQRTSSARGHMGHSKARLAPTTHTQQADNVPVVGSPWCARPTPVGHILRSGTPQRMCEVAACGASFLTPRTKGCSNNKASNWSGGMVDMTAVQRNAPVDHGVELHQARILAQISLFLGFAEESVRDVGL